MKRKQRSRRKSASELRASESRLPFIPAQVLRGLLALLLRPFKGARTRARHRRSFASKPTDSGTLEPACWIRNAGLEGHQTRKGRVSAVPHSGLNQSVSGWRRPSLARPSQTVLLSAVRSHRPGDNCLNESQRSGLGNGSAALTAFINHSRDLLSERAAAAAMKASELGMPSPLCRDNNPGEASKTSTLDRSRSPGCSCSLALITCRTLTLNSCLAAGKDLRS